MQTESNAKSSKFFLPYDIYERHRKVGSLIMSSQSVLDIGGQLNQLAQFCKPSKIVVANLKNSLEQSDIPIRKNKLPFSQNSYDVVCSIDVLEHIPKNKRGKFINQILEVAKDKVILSFPIGTQKHLKYEKEIQNWLEAKSFDATYLKEHIKNGLPTQAEITNLTSGLKSQVLYSGNIVLNRYLFKIYIFDPHIKFIRKLVYIAKLAFNFLTNPIIYQFLSDKNFDENVNRAYLVIYKES